jgi:HlyD family secretion protein
VRSAEARVRLAQANVEQAQVNLGGTTLRSPIDGIVLDRKVTIGQTVAAQFQAPDLFTLAQNLDQMQVEAAVDEADIGQVRTGASATFTVDAFPEETFEGTVTEVRKAPLVTQNVVTYIVIIRTQNKGLRLMPGMTATVGIQVETREDVLLVANEALRFQPPAAVLKTLQGSSPSPDGSPRGGGRRRGGGGPRLFTLENGQLVPHKIKTGITDGTNTELVEAEGLKEGDEVVVEALSATPKPVTTGNPGGRGGGRGPRLF